MHYLCMSMSLATRSYIEKMDMGFLVCATMLVHAVQMKAKQALMSLHRLAQKN